MQILIIFLQNLKKIGKEKKPFHYFGMNYSKE